LTLTDEERDMQMVTLTSEAQPRDAKH